MKSKTRILIAFILNIAFSIFEFIGGTICGSISIISDAIHDLGDAGSIGISLFMEKISEKNPDNKYTYGYRRYSILGGLITTIILIIGTIIVITNAIHRLINPIGINLNGMILFAIVGCIINFIAAKLTHSNHSINQKAVSLHMMEDMLGWIAVLISAIIMKLTNWFWIDPIISIILSIFIAYHAIKNMLAIISMFLLKTPTNINIDHIKESIAIIPGVKDIHHIHVWSLDEVNNIATLHVVAPYSASLKQMIKQTLERHRITHSTIEFENEQEHCHDKQCHIKQDKCECCHHHH